MEEVQLPLCCFTWERVLLLLPTCPARIPAGQGILGSSAPDREILLQGGKPWPWTQFALGKVCGREGSRISHPRSSSFVLFTENIINTFLQLCVFLLKLEINSKDVDKMFWNHNHRQVFVFSLTCELVFTSFLLIL